MNNVKTVKKLEIAIPAVELGKITKILDRVGIVDYTVIKNVTGKGERGQIFDDLEIADMGGDYILAICDESHDIQALIDGVRPLLKKYGGMCIISDAHFVIH
jgi:nitrogen regulatory protein PII